MEHSKAKLDLSEKIKLKEEPFSEVSVPESKDVPKIAASQPNSNQLQASASDSNPGAAEDPNYCHNRSSEWKPVRPNFWIPIVAVTSFATPLFMLICLVTLFSGLPHLSIGSFKHAVHLSGTISAILFCVLLSIPSFIGLASAYKLSKASLRLSAKLTLWWIISVGACVAWYAIYISLHLSP